MYKKITAKHCGNALFNLINTPIVMRLFAIMLITSMHMSVFAFAQKITLNKKNVPLTSVIKEIKKQSGYNFLYDSNALLRAPRVNIDVEEATVIEALDQCLEGLALGYVINDHNIIISKRIVPIAKIVQQREITGRVTDEQGDPLEGVTVSLKGRSTSTITNNDGTYRLSVQGNDAGLVFSIIGYEAREESLSADNVLNVSLSEQVSNLDEVVVVGYGTQKKVNMTGSVGTISSDEIADRTFSNTSRAIQGLSPGLTIIDRGGAPGKENMEINIRGVGTLGNANPLILVDNIPVGSMNDVRPDDIASISILKDAASAAIYGSRAANGVILITTKRGKSGGVSVDYHGFASMQNPTRLPESVSIGDYLQIMNEGYRNRGLVEPYSPEYIQGSISGEDPYRFPDTDWLKVVFSERGLSMNHSLGVSGGSDVSNFRLSLGYYDEKGIVQNTDAETYSARLNNDFKIGERIKVGTNMAFIRRDNAEPGRISELYWNLYNDLPRPTVSRYPDGTYGLSRNNSHPLAVINESGTNNQTVDDYFLSATVGYKIIEGLELNGSYSLRSARNSQKNFLNEYTFNDFFSGNQLHKWDNSLSISETNVSEINRRLILNYAKNTGTHDISGMLGGEQTINKGLNLTGKRSFFYSNDLQELPLGDPNTRDNSSYTEEWKLQSLFGRVNYAYLSKYLIEANFRYDGSSRFAQENRYGLFPSFSVGYMISKEKFMEPLTMIDELKIRASWGQLGNQDIGLYQYQQAINLGEYYNFNGGLVDGVAMTALANRDISWETTTSKNLGLDAQLFGGKWSASLDIFNRVTEDILLEINIPYHIGMEAPTQNVGVVHNNGYEIQLTHKNKIGEFGYELSGNFTQIDNKVVDLAGTGPVFTGAEDRLVLMEGYSINSLYGFESLGLFRSEEELAGYPRFDALTTLGSVKYRDVNGDGIINDDDRVVLGNTEPKYTYAFNLSFKYKGISLNTFWQGAAGVYAMPVGGMIDGPYWGSFIHENWLDRWTPDNPDGGYPSVHYQQSRPNTQSSSFWRQDVSYLRLKNLQVGYDIPSNFLNRINVRNARIYLAATNLLTFTPAENYVDPEVNSGRLDAYPQIQTFSLGTNISF